MSNKLYMRWSKREKDLLLNYPNSPDKALTFNAFCGKTMTRDWEKKGGPIVWEDSFVDELKKRGYDITTLKFSIEKLNP